MGFDVKNIGSKAVQKLKDEVLIPNIEKASATVIDGAVAGVEGFVADIGVDISSALTQVTDFSLFKGVNVDSFFDLGGQANNPFGDLSLTGLSAKLPTILGNKFSLDDIVDQFGIGGLFGNKKISVITDVAPKLSPEPNVLHEYASFTYRLTLGAQDLKDHQEIAEAGEGEDDKGFIKGTPKMTAIMMVSGGGHEVDGVTRDSIFEEDFYIEDLKMTTVIGSSAAGQGSNAIELSFTIMEPYAVSLIERLLALAEKLNYKNYIHIPYIFKIEFIGYNDAGEMLGIIPNTTKYIPFQLTYMQFQVSGKGSAYKCIGIPMSQMTFNQTVQAIPQEVQVAAGKIGEFFNGKPTGDSGNNTTGGFVETINAFHAKLAVDTAGSSARNAPDKIVIKIHKAIADHQLQIANLSKVGMLKENFNPGAQVIDVSKPTYSFHAGTAITSVIRNMVLNSTYWTNQIKANDKIRSANAAEAFSLAEGRVGAKTKATKEIPTVGVKITSSYKMLEYDEKANRHAYEATFIVAPYETAGHQSPSAGRSEIENIAKVYDYLFTGKNQDILDLSIKFDLAFYNSLTTNTEDAADAVPAGNNPKVTGGDPGDNLPQAGDAIMQTPIDKKPPFGIEHIGNATAEEVAKLKASALERSIMQSSAGDMITLDLTILGDPAFIKQDDILYRAEDDNSNAHTFNGSIKQDNGDMYLRLIFKTYDDINHDTGLRFEARNILPSSFQRHSTFDGFYRILMIDNIFSEGRFTQKLVVVRTYVQDTDKPASDTAVNLTSNLVSYQQNIKDLASAGIDGVAGSATSYLNSVKEAAILTASQQVDEAKALAADFAAELVPLDAAEFKAVTEDLISNISLTLSAQSIVDITLASPRRGRGRFV